MERTAGAGLQWLKWWPGGWIGVAQGRSANLLLYKQGPDDLYGRWVVCEIGIMALANPEKLIGRFGITEKTAIPFGFRDSDFYDQMQYATGMMHVFTYWVKGVSLNCAIFSREHQILGTHQVPIAFIVASAKIATLNNTRSSGCPLYHPLSSLYHSVGVARASKKILHSSFLFKRTRTQVGKEG